VTHAANAAPISAPLRVVLRDVDGAHIANANEQSERSFVGTVGSMDRPDKNANLGTIASALTNAPERCTPDDQRDRQRSGVSMC
jgi:hypothetical protein